MKTRLSAWLSQAGDLAHPDDVWIPQQPITSKKEKRFELFSFEQYGSEHPDNCWAPNTIRRSEVKTAKDVLTTKEPQNVERHTAPIHGYDVPPFPHQKSPQQAEDTVLVASWLAQTRNRRNRLAQPSSRRITIEDYLNADAFLQTGSPEFRFSDARAANNSTYKARQKAARIAKRYLSYRRSELQSVLDALEAVFLTFKSGAAYEQIKRVFRRGTHLEAFIQVASVKEHWQDASHLWLTRRYDRLRRKWTIQSTPQLKSSGLSWHQTSKLLEEWSADYILDLIEGDWRYEWQQLRRRDFAGRPAPDWFYSYPSFILYAAASWCPTREIDAYAIDEFSEHFQLHYQSDYSGYGRTSHNTSLLNSTTSWGDMVSPTVSRTKDNQA